MTVGQFYDMVFLNEYHNIRVKSSETDKTITEFSRSTEVKDESLLDKEIKEFAPDWEKRIYILWV